MLAAIAGAIKIADEVGDCTNFTGTWNYDKTVVGATEEKYPITLDDVCVLNGTLKMASGEAGGAFTMENGELKGQSVLFEQVYEDKSRYEFDCKLSNTP